MLESLRELLLQEPSDELWLEVTALFERSWSEDELQVGLDYAMQHLEAWDPHQRHYTIEPDVDHKSLPLYWPLVRRLIIEGLGRKKFSKKVTTFLQQVVSGGAITHICVNGAGLSNVNPLGSLTEVVSLELCEMYELRNTSGIAEMKQLKWLKLHDLELDLSLHFLKSLTQLQELYIGGDSTPGSLKGIESLGSLRKLTLDGCEFVEDFQPLGRLEQLEELELSHCEHLHSLEVLSDLRSLKTLTICGCKWLRSLSGLETLTQLEHLDLSALDEGWFPEGASVDISAVIHLPALKVFNPPSDELLKVPPGDELEELEEEAFTRQYLEVLRAHYSN